MQEDTEIVDDSISDEALDLIIESYEKRCSLILSECSALLTHVSIMIAVSTAYTLSENYFKNISGIYSAISIVLYLIVSCMCLIVMANGAVFFKRGSDKADAELFKIRLNRLIFSKRRALSVLSQITLLTTVYFVFIFVIQNSIPIIENSGAAFKEMSDNMNKLMRFF